ncbi:hypothetical protein QBC44DRAFT_69945 [Cladorrhinum sp. PSN332]|nr:hypothetical protein QBC44DRAFT_69945 [Cladorrhinum sp. PSN332]
MLTTRTLLPTLLFSLTARASPVLVNRQFEDTCWNRILDLQWTVDDLSYTASYVTTAPDSEQSSWGYVGFSLSSSAVPYTADCVAASTVGFDGAVAYTCTLSEGAPEAAGVKFRYNKEEGKLELEEVVLCSEGEGHTATFVAKGETDVSLECTDETRENEDWQEGEVYKDREVKCAPVDTYLWPSQVIGRD